MSDIVLSQTEREFIRANQTQIEHFANGTFAGSIGMEQRQMYEQITLKLGRRFNICWTCGNSLKRIGLQLMHVQWQ